MARSSTRSSVSTRRASVAKSVEHRTSARSTPAESRPTKYLYPGDTPQTPAARRSSTQSHSSNTTASKGARSNRKRKNNRWEDESEEEDDYLTTKRRGVYLEAYNNSSYGYEDDESMTEREDDEVDGGDDEFAGEEEEDSLAGAPVSTAGKQLPWARALRPRSPPVFNKKDLPVLQLPACSQDLLLSEEDVNRFILPICSVYEILRHFKHQLRLSAFRVEEFIAALQLDEMNSLCSEIHITLLKVLVKEDELNSTLIGSTDVKDSVNIHLWCCDPMTWPHALKMYLSARARGQLTKSNVGDLGAKRVIESITNTNYPIGVSMDVKLQLLQYLCDSFLETSIARDEITNIESMTIKHDDHCRKCHKLGDLLCCDNCPSVWHLQCVDPPMSTVPNNDWICHICKAMNIEEIEVASVRKEILGWDRHGRKYWWLCQRLIVEQDNVDQNDDEDTDIENDNETNQPEPRLIFYYSTKRQFNDLLAALDPVKFEKELCQVLFEMKEDILRGFETINQCTNNALKSKGLVLQNVKSWIELHSGEKDGEESGVDHHGLSESSATAGIVTRLKTGAIQPKSVGDNNLVRNDYHTEDRDVLFYWDAEKNNRVLKRTNKKFLPNISSLIFKLGMEGRYYVNYFNVNILALNKYQQQEERDKRRQLSWKFSLTPLSEFKWIGPVTGARTTLIQTLRQTIINFEGSLQAPFLHPNWSLHRQNWLKAVQICDNAKDFALALSILESSIKPILFNPVWNDSLGHNLLERVTSANREERKNIEKRERREQSEELDMLMRLGGVKYSLFPNRSRDGVWAGPGGGRGVHQLWKQRGEEYRVTGKGGWSWRSATRIQHRDLTPIEIDHVDELSEEETAALTSLSGKNIDVMREIVEKEEKKRPFYPKHFKKANRPKLQILEGLLEKRLALKAAIEAETKKLDQKLATVKKVEQVPSTSYQCYSPLCRSGQLGSNQLCYSYDCHLAKHNDDHKEDGDKQTLDKSTKDEEEEEEDVHDQIYYCVKPVYLYRVNERGEVVRKLNTKRVLGKGQLPPCSQFCTKSKKKSIFVLPSFELKRLSRTAALREVRGFSYTAKVNPYIWPFGTTPRPMFRTCWLYRNSIIEKHHGIENVSTSLRIIWSCIRWDDMANKPPVNGVNTITTESEVITTELLKRRDLPPFGLRSEYLVRKIIVPLDYENEKDDEWKDSSRSKEVQPAWKREGLRERKKKVDPDAEAKRQGPSVTEQWMMEEELQLWEIKGFGEKLERQQQMIKDKEKERVQKEFNDRIRKQKEENARKQLEERRRQAELNRAKQSASNSEGYAMIRTVAGQTYRVPLSALQGKQPGEQISIKLAASGQQNTMTATILQLYLPNATSKTGQNVKISSSSTASTNSSASMATGISSSTLLPHAQTGQKFQIIKQTQPSVQPVTTVKMMTNAVNPMNSNATISIPLPLANGRVQIIQVPASMFSGNRQIQITIPQMTSGGTNTTQVLQVASSIQPNAVVASSNVMPSNNSTAVNTNSTAGNTLTNSTNHTSLSSAANENNSGSQVVTPTVSATSTSTMITTSQQSRTLILPSTPATSNSISSTLTSQTTQPFVQGQNQLRIIQADGSVPSSPRIIQMATTSGSNEPVRFISTSQLSTSTGGGMVTNTPGTIVLQNTNGLRLTPAILQSKAPVITPQIVQANKPIVNVATPNSILSAAPPTTSSVTLGNNVQLLQHQQLDEKMPDTIENEPKFQVTPQMTSSIVAAALNSKTNTPEIQQKLLAMQKHHQQTAAAASVDTNQPIPSSVSTISTAISSSVDKKSSGALSRGIGRSRNVRGNLVMAPNGPSNIVAGNNAPLSNDDRDFLAIKTLMKFMLDKLEKDEKLETKRKKSRENQLLTKWRQQTTRTSLRMQRNMDCVRKEMLRRRALLQKEIENQVEAEVKSLQIVLTQPPATTTTTPIKMFEKSAKKSSDAATSLSLIESTSIAGNTISQSTTPSVVRIGNTAVKIKIPPAADAASNVKVGGNFGQTAIGGGSAANNAPSSLSNKRRSTTSSGSNISNISSGGGNSNSSSGTSTSSGGSSINNNNNSNESSSSYSNVDVAHDNLLEIEVSNSSDSNHAIAAAIDPIEICTPSIVNTVSNTVVLSTTIASPTPPPPIIPLIVNSKRSITPSNSASSSPSKRIRTHHHHTSLAAMDNSSSSNVKIAQDGATESANIKSVNKSRKLYCICRQPYDSNRFMVGCDYCHNWFHCDCLRIKEELIKETDSFVCAHCRVEYADELNEEQLRLPLPPLEEINNGANRQSTEESSESLKRKVESISPTKKSIVSNGRESVKESVSIVKKEPSGRRSVNTTTNTPVAVTTLTSNNSSSTTTTSITSTNGARPSSKKGNTNKSKSKVELFCVCRKPYNESQFYVQCERCSEWLHGRCVGVLCKEAEKIEVYLCPQCDPNSTINYANQKQLDSTDFVEMKKLLKQIQQHKNAWPFLRPVDERQVPDYYNIITEPMDLATIESKLNRQSYDTLTAFIGDITKIFDNCRYYNDTKSAITHCANLLENFFVQKITSFRQQMINH